uniref:Uncharacterized protein n=1 Tax=Knipowitschia caucasica TaxID=637954 RepID=A0AAV2LUD1_KNICA
MEANGEQLSPWSRHRSPRHTITTLKLPRCSPESDRAKRHASRREIPASPRPLERRPCVRASWSSSGIPPGSQKVAGVRLSLKDRRRLIMVEDNLSCSHQPLALAAGFLGNMNMVMSPLT